MKIIVSSWPGCGATTLTILLAEIYNLKLVQGTQSFRLLLEAMNISGTGEGIIYVETLIQPFFGPVYDRYMKDLFLDSTQDNIIADSDILGFFVPNSSNLYKIFLKGDKISRARHFTTDSRTEDIEILGRRDKELKNGYHKLYGIDLFSLDEINKNYNLILDNSKVLIAEELHLVSKMIDPAITKERSVELEAEYWTHGKQYFLDKLKKEERVIGGLDVLKAINEKYPDEVSKFPANLKTALQTLVL